MQTVMDYLKQHRERHLADLFDLLRVPSVSALSEHKNDVQQAAAWLRDYMERIGLHQVEVIQTAGHPLVYGEWLELPDKPTVLIYGHYDVQPVDPLNLWETPPFEPKLHEGHIYARGASDDKGQVMMHLRALEAMLATHGRLPVNVKVLIEGEEEVGSPNLGPYVEQAAQALAADVIVISDTSMPAPDLPAIAYSLRGIAALEFTVRGANTDLHSGLFGGAVPNALHEMARLVASLHDTDGRVNIPGFYDDVVDLTDAEREALAKYAEADEDFMAELGLAALVGEAAYTTTERIGARPTLELNGMWGGFQGEGSKTVIPAVAHGKITCRLVPNQDPERIARLVADALRERVPEAVTVEVTEGHGGRPWLCDPTTPPVQAGLQALAKAFGTEPTLMRMGGSIPVVETLDRVLQVPIVLLGFALPTDQVHAPNERFAVANFDKGTEALVYYWYELADKLSS